MSRVIPNCLSFYRKYICCQAVLTTVWVWMDHLRSSEIWMPCNLKLQTLFTSVPLMWIRACSLMSLPAVQNHLLCFVDFHGLVLSVSHFTSIRDRVNNVGAVGKFKDKNFSYAVVHRVHKWVEHAALKEFLCWGWERRTWGCQFRLLGDQNNGSLLKASGDHRQTKWRWICLWVPLLAGQHMI